MGPRVATRPSWGFREALRYREASCEALFGRGASPPVSALVVSVSHPVLVDGQNKKFCYCQLVQYDILNHVSNLYPLCWYSQKEDKK